MPGPNIFYLTGLSMGREAGLANNREEGMACLIVPQLEDKRARQLPGLKRRGVSACSKCILIPTNKALRRLFMALKAGQALGH